jgi:hypothetical protein
MFRYLQVDRSESWATLMVTIDVLYVLHALREGQITIDELHEVLHRKVR